MRIQNIAIMGAGAMGAAYAAMFSETKGFSVSFAARGERYRRLAKGRLTVNGKQYTIPVIHPEKVEAPADLVIVALKHHNLKATKCAAIRSILAGLGARRIIYSGYYKTFKFWTDREDLPRAVLRGISLFDAGFQKAARLIRADNLPSPFFSPYSVTVAQF